MGIIHHPCFSFKFILSLVHTHSLTNTHKHTHTHTHIQTLRKQGETLSILRVDNVDRMTGKWQLLAYKLARKGSGIHIHQYSGIYRVCHNPCLIINRYYILHRLPESAKNMGLIILFGSVSSLWTLMSFYWLVGRLVGRSFLTFLNGREFTLPKHFFLITTI